MITSKEMPTPVKPNKLDDYLDGYDSQLRSYLVSGFKFGFNINNMSYTSTTSDKNAKTTSKWPEVVDKKIKKELDLGRLLGPFRNSPYNDAVISPLGVREKKLPGEYRLIHDLSFPYDGTSINDGIPRDCATVHYSTISDAIKLILKMGNNCYLAKSDIKSAFRIIPVHPSNYHLLGFRWRDLFYFDKCLPMGCSSSCKIFESFSTALHWITSQFLPDIGIVHVLDDFLFIAPTYEKCNNALETFVNICQDIGVPLAPEKTEGPSQILPFLGIELNTVDMLAALPHDKVERCLVAIDNCLQSKSVQLKVLQSLSGLLNFASSIILPARAFTRRVYDLTIGVKKSYYQIKMTGEVKKDLTVWKNFLMNYNYRTFFLDYRFISNTTLHLYTDSAASIGFGGVYGNKWFVGEWSLACRKLNIAILELYPICVALYVWGNCIKNKSVVMHTDNMAVMYILNNHTSKDRQIMILVRFLVFTCMEHNIVIRAEHIRGVDNSIADFISRSKVDAILKKYLHLDRKMTYIPDHITLDKLLTK